MWLGIFYSLLSKRDPVWSRCLLSLWYWICWTWSKMTAPIPKKRINWKPSSSFAAETETSPTEMRHNLLKSRLCSFISASSWGKKHKGYQPGREVCMVPLVYSRCPVNIFFTLIWGWKGIKAKQFWELKLNQCWGLDGFLKTSISMNLYTFSDLNCWNFFLIFTEISEKLLQWWETYKYNLFLFRSQYSLLEKWVY